ncbi:MAG: PAS domain-containing protein, partial [Chloroflexota bacterium]|nr:PAS domain-containing protein [Chloroflexota bacterium]
MSSDSPTNRSPRALSASTFADGLRSHAWKLYLGVGTLVSVAYFLVLVGPLQDLTYDLVGLSSVAAIVLGLVLHHPRHRTYWFLIAFSQLLFVAGDATYNVYEYVFHIQEYPFPSPADALYLAGYPFLAGGLLLLIRERGPGVDRAALIDAALITAAAAVASWIFLIGPSAGDQTLSPLGRVISAAYPLMDLLVLAATLRLLVGTSIRIVAFYLLCLGLLSLLVADSIYTTLVLAESYNNGNPVDAGWLISYLTLGSAALHPSMRTLPERAPAVTRATLGRARLGSLILAALLPPIVLLAQSLRGQAIDPTIIIVGSVVMTSLVLLRMVGTVRDREHTYHRLVESETRLSEAQRMAHLGNWEWDPRTGWLWWSNVAFRIYGFRPGAVEPTLDRLMDIVHPHDRTALVGAIDAALRDDSPYDFDHRIVRPDGEVRFVNRQGRVERSADGAPLRMVGTVHDITERKRAEEELRRSRASLVAGQELAHLGTWEW